MNPSPLSRQTRDALEHLLPGGADAAVVLGSGLGTFSGTVVSEIRIPLSDIPGAPRTGVAGHEGTLTLARIGSRRVLLFAGRVHGYEGRTIDEVTFPVRACAALGIPRMIVTNAAGGIGVQLEAGDLMLITDYMILPMAERMGLGMHAAGIPPAMHRPAPDAVLTAHIRDAARAAAVPLREGVYGFCSGPTYETRAEIAFLRFAGVAAVGMSTVPEFVAAQSAGIAIAGISCITNKARTVPTRVTHEEVTGTAARVSARFSLLLRTAVERL